MPGIVGFLSNTVSRDVVKDSVKNMQELITHKKFYKSDPVFSLDNMCATRSHTDILQTAQQPFSKNNVHIWLDGEIHNRDEVIDGSLLNIHNDLELLCHLYQEAPDLSFLSRIDGGFSAVIVDESNHTIHLITDRYGRQHLYWTRYHSGVAWASELKAFSALPGFDVEVDPLALEEFLGVGYMIGERTWLKNVTLIPAATAVTIHTKRLETSIIKYWSWDRVPSLNRSTDSRELAEQAGNLFIDAVEKQSKLTDTNVGITLSGGRDSRAVLAAMPDDGEPIHAITFGKRNCTDVHYASKAIQIKKGVHHVYKMNASNWLVDRIESIWWTDGQVSFIHLNGATEEPKDTSFFNIAFSGLGGELLAGKCELFEINNVVSYIDKRYVNLHVTDRLKDRLTDHIKEMGSPIAYELNHRFMKFVTMGLKRGDAFGVRVRVPFLDNRLVEFMLGIPAEYRKKAKLYDTMLLLKFPEYYKDLDWVHTDLSVGLDHKCYYYLQKLKKRTRRRLAKFGIGEELSSNMTDFEAWIRQEPARSLFSDLLNSNRALYPEYIDRSTVVNSLNEHLSGKNNTTLLCRYVTFEIWLQQLFNKRFREGELKFN